MSERTLNDAEFDVVVLCLNRLEMTRDTVRSVLDQRDVDLTVWLVDQGSEPTVLHGLRQIAADEPDRVRLIENGRNLGVPGGRNVGSRQGNAKYLVSIDNDAVFDSAHALAICARQFEADPALGVIGFRVLNFTTRQLDRLAWSYPATMLPKAGERFLTTRFAGTGHAIRRTAFEQAGGYDADLFFCWEEIDISYRIINAGFTLVYDPAVTILHRTAPDERRDWKGDRFYFQVRNALYSEFKHTDLWSALALRGAGYLAKGLRNGVPGQAARGLKDAVIWSRRHRAQQPAPYLLNPQARAYLSRYDDQVRGNPISRLRNEVVAALPAARNG